MSKILIVEDDALLSRMYHQAFLSAGHEVLTATDGEDGLAKAVKESPDIILLDIMMPKISGLQVLDKLKSNPTIKKTPVVILTNLSDEKKAEEALSLGAIKYLVKSDYKPKQVLQIVTDLISGSQRKEIPNVT